MECTVSETSNWERLGGLKNLGKKVLRQGWFKSCKKAVTPSG